LAYPKSAGASGIFSEDADGTGGGSEARVDVNGALSEGETKRIAEFGPFELDARCTGDGGGTSLRLAITSNADGSFAFESSSAGDGTLDEGESALFSPTDPSTDEEIRVATFATGNPASNVFLSETNTTLQLLTGFTGADCRVVGVLDSITPGPLDYPRARPPANWPGHPDEGWVRTERASHRGGHEGRAKHHEGRLRAAPHRCGYRLGMTAGPREIRAAGGAVVRDGLVAVVHRPKYGDWSLPKGKLEPGETWEQAALREVEEETGLRCTLAEALESTRYTDRKGRPKEVRYWRMEVAADTGFEVSDEVDALRWVPFAEARALLTHAHDRALVHAVVSLTAGRRPA
jgi:8-oxo-dGTP diphosphatase